MTDLQNKYHTLQESKRHNRVEESRAEREFQLKKKIENWRKGNERVNAITKSSKDITGMFKDLAGGLRDVVGSAGSIAGMLG